MKQKKSTLQKCVQELAPPCKKVVQKSVHILGHFNNVLYNKNIFFTVMKNIYTHYIRIYILHYHEKTNVRNYNFEKINVLSPK